MVDLCSHTNLFASLHYLTLPKESRKRAAKQHTHFPAFPVTKCNWDMPPPTPRTLQSGLLVEYKVRPCPTTKDPAAWAECETRNSTCRPIACSQILLGRILINNNMNRSQSAVSPPYDALTDRGVEWNWVRGGCLVIYQLF